MLNFGSIADSVGNTFNKAKAAGQDIFGDQVELSAEIIPRGVVLSSRYNLFLKNMNEDESPLAIGDIDSVDKTMKIETVKRFRPFGFQFQRTIQRVLGWEFSFRAKLDGWEMPYIMQSVQDSIMGAIEDHNPKNLPGYNGIPSVGNAPLFSIVEEITFKDHSRISFIYERFMFDAYSESIPDDNAPIELSFSGFAQRRYVNEINVQDNSALANIDNDIVAAMNLINSRGLS